MSLSDVLSARLPVGRLGVFASRKADLDAPFSLSDTARSVLASHGLDEAEQGQLAGVYEAGRSAVQSGAALDYLKSLDTPSLLLLQEATFTGKDIDLGALSEEQAENLLLQPGEGIDSNHDGAIKTVDGTIRMFPPLNAPTAVKEAWTRAFQDSGPDGPDIAGIGDMISDWMARGDTPEAPAPRFGDPGFDWSGFVAGERATRQSDTSPAGAAVSDLLQRFAEALKASGLSV